MNALQPERVSENLNRALHEVLAHDERVSFIGEDVLDPYGGAFGVSRGLSTRFGDRVLTTPISEAAIVGFAAGLSLMGQKPIVEIMFGDFVTLAYDQIVNFLSKSVTMYGEPCELNCVVRVPIGGGRGYGPTHSQSLQKHFIGIPNLDLYELSPFVDNREVFFKLLNAGRPCLFFEDKVLYTNKMFRDGRVDDVFSFEYIDKDQIYARIYCADFRKVRCSIITTGGAALRCIDAIRDLIIDVEVECQIIVASRLYPIALAPLANAVATSEFIFTVEEGVRGGGWGNEVAAGLYGALWGKLRNPIGIICSEPSIIPAARHLERQVLIQKEGIYRIVREAACAVDSNPKIHEQRR
ncbi:alpha-ketoacid dehydrogenase subunit beta [Bradyrhizobium prioriisuperbiae]|uniref:alpha-ketoacid dehydrogenase subunit beta n=1 Tax=Bradyrhizobium prioriisuperbiae TaxID=2854389 RepID=UPI0028E39D3F|nr:transketolase C-terminal domain-containing protein [Bradyrhizobium prioritasuperba]